MKHWGENFEYEIFEIVNKICIVIIYLQTSQLVTPKKQIPCDENGPKNAVKLEVILISDLLEIFRYN